MEVAEQGPGHGTNENRYGVELDGSGGQLRTRTVAPVTQENLQHAPGSQAAEQDQRPAVAVGQQVRRCPDQCADHLRVPKYALEIATHLRGEEQDEGNEHQCGWPKPRRNGRCVNGSRDRRFPPEDDHDQPQENQQREDALVLVFAEFEDEILTRSGRKRREKVHDAKERDAREEQGHIDFSRHSPDQASSILRQS